MILVIFGQPCAGKTTISNRILELGYNAIHLDGDKIRDIFANKDYSRDGRIKSLKTASDIATYMNSTGDNVVMSLVYPYKEARAYLNSLNKNIYWIYLTYEGVRGRESFHVKDFEAPNNDEIFLKIDTSKESFTECKNKIIKYAKYFSEIK